MADTSKGNTQVNHANTGFMNMASASNQHERDQISTVGTSDNLIRVEGVFRCNLPVRTPGSHGF